MLYNQGLLSLAFVEAWEITGDPAYARAAERTFAYVLRDRLWFPVDEPLREALVAEGCGPFDYEKGGRTITVAKFHEAPSACLDDPDALLDWAARAARAARAM